MREVLVAYQADETMFWRLTARFAVIKANNTTNFLTQIKIIFLDILLESADPVGSF